MTEHRREFFIDLIAALALVAVMAVGMTLFSKGLSMLMNLQADEPPDLRDLCSEALDMAAIAAEAEAACSVELERCEQDLRAAMGTVQKRGKDGPLLRDAAQQADEVAEAFE